MTDDHIDCRDQVVKLTFTAHELHVLMACHTLVCAQIAAAPEFAEGGVSFDPVAIMKVAAMQERVEHVVLHDSRTWHQQMQLRVMRELGMDTSLIETLDEIPDPEAFGDG